MKREDILGFVNIIIKNGIENNLESNVVKQSILDYAKYLVSQNFVDEETVNILMDLSNCTEELMQLSRKISTEDVLLPLLQAQMLTGERVKNVQSENLSASAPTTMDQTMYNRITPSYSSTCGSGRRLGGRSC